MKNIPTLETFLNESINEGKVGDKLTALFTKETGIQLWDDIRDSELPGKWMVTRLWAPKDTGGMNPGLHMEITKGSSTAHWMVMDDKGKLTDSMKRIKKI
jgi:hypothetical protein